MAGWQDRRCVVWTVGGLVGEAVARGLAARGAQLLLVDEDAGYAETVAASCAGSVSRIVATEAVDVAQWVEDNWGALDALIDCTSSMETWPAEHDTPAALAAVLEGNVVVPWVHTDALAPALAQGRTPGVVYLGSVDGTCGNPQVPAYSAGKAGTAALARTMAVRLGRHGIRVNCVAAAGVMQTHRRHGAALRVLGNLEEAIRWTPLGRMPTADEIADAAIYLASEEASAVSGVELTVDGGRTCTTPGTW